MSDKLKLALHLHSLGFSILPLWPSKRPAVKWKKLQTQRATAADLLRWFVKHPWRPGIITGRLSGLVAVDCDNEEAVEAYCCVGQAFTPLQQQTKRGRHFLFAFPDREVRNTVRLGGYKIDRRGEGGYVVAYYQALDWTRDDLLAAPEYIEPFPSRPLPAGRDTASSTGPYDLPEFSWPVG